MPWLERLLAPISDERWIQCLIILGASLLLAWLLDRVLSVVFRRWAARTETELDDEILAILHRPVRTSVVLSGLALISLHLELGGEAGAGGEGWSLTTFTLSALATLAIVIWTVAGVRLVTVLLQATSRRFDFVETRTLPLFSNLARVLLVGVAIYFVFLAWKIDLTAWLASAGIIGIAVGFAAKDTLANLFAGIFILADAPYKVGDFVNLDSGERGEVTHVGIRSTRLLTRDDIEITLPNSVIGNSRIINESGGRWSRERLRIKVGVAYGSDVDQVRRVLLEVAGQESQVCAEPAPRVRFRNFGDSGLDFELLVWIEEPILRGQVQDAVNTAVYKRFMAEGIEIPYPKRDIYIHSLPADLR